MRLRRPQMPNRAQVGHAGRVACRVVGVVAGHTIETCIVSAYMVGVGVYLATPPLLRFGLRTGRFGCRQAMRLYRYACPDRRPALEDEVTPIVGFYVHGPDSYRVQDPLIEPTPQPRGFTHSEPPPVVRRRAVVLARQEIYDFNHNCQSYQGEPWKPLQAVHPSTLVPPNVLPNNPNMLYAKINSPDAFGSLLHVSGTPTINLPPPQPYYGPAFHLEYRDIWVDFEWKSMEAQQIEISLNYRLWEARFYPAQAALVTPRDDELGRMVYEAQRLGNVHPGFYPRVMITHLNGTPSPTPNQSLIAPSPVPAPQGFPQTPQGFSQAPQGFSHAPQGFSQAPQGFPHASSGFPQTPQDQPSNTGPRRILIAKSRRQAQPLLPQTPQDQSSNTGSRPMLPLQPHPQATPGFPQTPQNQPSNTGSRPMAQYTRRRKT